jgi:Protein of unknown function (DUF3485)
LNKPSQILICLIAVGVTFTTALLHGRWTNRWGTPAAQVEAQAVLAGLPHDFGPWRLVESDPLPAAARGILQCSGETQGVYENQETGERVMFTLLLGPPGPMSVHTPEICYGSLDHVPLADRQRITIDESTGKDTVWMVQFHDLHELQGNITRVYYSWSESTNWNAVEEPRIQFGGGPYLFKLQLLVRLPEEAAVETQDPGRGMLREFVPVFAHATASLKHADD